MTSQRGIIFTVTVAALASGCGSDQTTMVCSSGPFDKAVLVISSDRITQIRFRDANGQYAPIVLERPPESIYRPSAAFKDYSDYLIMPFPSTLCGGSTDDALTLRNIQVKAAIDAAKIFARRIHAGEEITIPVLRINRPMHLAVPVQEGVVMTSQQTTITPRHFATVFKVMEIK